MKRFLFSTLFFSLMMVGVQAQSSSCIKKCTAKQASSKSCKGKSASTTASTSTIDAAAKLASMDKSIESKTCAVSGTVSYCKKETSDKGEVSYVDVNYDSETNTFVNASPMKMEKSKGCSGKSTSAKGCCAGKSASASSGKGCCAGKSTSKTASASITGEQSSEIAAKPTKG